MEPECSSAARLTAKPGRIWPKNEAAMRIVMAHPLQGLGEVTFSQRIREHREAFRRELSEASQRYPVLVRSVLIGSAVVAVLSIGGPLWYLARLQADLPDDDAIARIGEMDQATTVYDGHDQLAFTIFRQRDRLPLSSVSPHLISAILAIEDQRFYDHRGFDVHSHRRRPHWPTCGSRRAAAGRQHHHAAARASELSHARQDDAPQAAGADARGADRGDVLEGRDSRALSQQGVLRGRVVRRRGGVARLFRQAARPSCPSPKRRCWPAS